jgi:Protein of unknown function (DUF1523)
MTRRTKARVIGIGVLLVVIAFLLNPNCNIDSYNVKVVDKIVKDLDGKQVYMIYTIRENGKERVFVDRDSKLYFKFNSADVYARMEKGKWYRVRTVGWRFPMKSWFENILSAKSLPGPPPGAKAP